MATSKEKRAIVRALKDTIVHLCKNSSLYGGRIEVDGIICITGQGEGQELVVKVHETLGYESGRYYESNGRDYGSGMDEAQDLRKKRRLEDSAYDEASPEYSEMSMEQDYLDGDLDDSEAKDLSMGAGAIVISPDGVNDSRSSPSPNYSGLSPEGRPPTSFVGTSMFHSASPNMPYYIPKRTPVKHERWSPNQPIPTVPECKQCGFNFDSFDILAEHNEAVHSVFTCQSCFKTFTSRSNLERHSRLHTGHKPYVCTICNKAFSRKDHLSNHATKHAYKCGTCSKRFSDKKMLVTHYQFDHNAVLTNICDFCNKGFSSSEMYEEHVKIHPQFHGDCPESPSPVPHSHSPAVARSLISAASTPVNMKKYACKQCGFSSGDSLTLAKHSLVHADAQRCYTCLACAKMFEDPLHYSDHMLVHQNEVNVFECVICRQLCSTLQSLRRHEANHVTELMEAEGTSMLTPSPAYPCQKCPRTFSNQYMLREHMEMHRQHADHDEQRRSQAFACPSCNTDFDSYKKLVYHMEKEGHFASPPQGSSTEQASENRRDKRKQTYPKPLQLKIQPPQEPEDEDEEDEEYEIVEPESPGDADATPKKIKTDENSNRYSSKEEVNDTKAATITSLNEDEDRDENGTPIKKEPVRSLMFSRSNKRNHGDGTEPESPTDARSNTSSTRGSPPVESNNNSIVLPNNATTPTSSGSNPPSVPVTPSKASNVDCPPGPYTCSVCSTVCPNFQDLEMHCFSEHNRSPCMFCSKTFAQKANRDRHVCLHTGEKPYACPECDEKFSRGDKLKLHRIRAHKVEFPVFKRDPSASPSPSPAGGSESRDSQNYDGGVWGRDESGEYPWSRQLKYPNMSAYSGGHWSVKSDSPPDLPRTESPMNLEVSLKNNGDTQGDN